MAKQARSLLLLAAPGRMTLILLAQCEQGLIYHRLEMSGYKGVAWNKENKKWGARISLPGGRRKFLGE